MKSIKRAQGLVPAVRYTPIHSCKYYPVLQYTINCTLLFYFLHLLRHCKSKLFHQSWWNNYYPKVAIRILFYIKWDSVYVCVCVWERERLSTSLIPDAHSPWAHILHVWPIPLWRRSLLSWPPPTVLWRQAIADWTWKCWEPWTGSGELWHWTVRASSTLELNPMSSWEPSKYY